MSVLIFENLEFLTFILTEQIVDIYEHCHGVIFLNYLYSRLQNFQKFCKFFSSRKFLKNSPSIFRVKKFDQDLTKVLKSQIFPKINNFEDFLSKMTKKIFEKFSNEKSLFVA